MCSAAKVPRRTDDTDEVADHVVGVAGLEVAPTRGALPVDAALEQAGDRVRRPHRAHGRVKGGLKVLDERRHLCGRDRVRVQIGCLRTHSACCKGSHGIYLASLALGRDEQSFLLIVRVSAHECRLQRDAVPGITRQYEGRCRAVVNADRDNRMLSTGMYQWSRMSIASQSDGKSWRTLGVSSVLWVAF